MEYGEEAVQNKGDGKTEADKGAQAQSKVEPTFQPRERPVWGIGYVKRKLQERKAKREEQSPADKAAHATARATWWIAAFTIVLAILSGLTWWEIHTGGADTHDLAVQAKRQADKTKGIADAAEKMRLASERLARSSEENVQAVELSNTRSKAALDASISASHNDQRAWLGAWKFSIVSDAEVGTGFLSQYEVENSGKTPALNVVTNSATFFDINEDRNIDWSSIKVEHRGILWPAMSIGPILAGKGSEQTTTQHIVDGYRKHITKIYVIIKITYDDVFGCSHWTQVCTVHSYGQSPVAFDFCNRNGIDDADSCKASLKKGAQKAN